MPTNKLLKWEKEGIIKKLTTTNLDAAAIARVYGVTPITVRRIRTKLRQEEKEVITRIS